MDKHSVSMRDAKAHLSELASQAEQGTEIVILRHGKPAAKLVPVDTPRLPVSLERLRRLTETMDMQSEGAGVALRQLRDEARY